MLLLAATACSSASDNSTGESLPDTAVEATGGDTASPSTPAPTPGTDATSDATTASTPEPDDTGADDPSTTEAAVVVPEALQFAAPLVGGGTFDGAAVAGKPTVFWFWAPT